MSSNLIIGVKLMADRRAQLTAAQLHVGLGEPSGTQEVRLGVEVSGDSCSTGH